MSETFVNLLPTGCPGAWLAMVNKIWNNKGREGDAAAAAAGDGTGQQRATVPGARGRAAESGGEGQLFSCLGRVIGSLSRGGFLVRSVRRALRKKSLAPSRPVLLRILEAHGKTLVVLSSKLLAIVFLHPCCPSNQLIIPCGFGRLWLPSSVCARWSSRLRASRPRGIWARRGMKFTSLVERTHWLIRRIWLLAGLSKHAGTTGEG